MIKRNKIVYFVSNLKNERNPKCTLEYDRLSLCSFLYCFRPYFWIRRSYGIVVVFCLVILVFTWWRRCLTKVKTERKEGYQSIREIANTNSDLIFYNDILNTFWWHSFITVCIFESWQVAQRMKISKDRIHAILWHLYDFFNNLWNISILI